MLSNATFPMGFFHWDFFHLDFSVGFFPQWAPAGQRRFETEAPRPQNPQNRSDGFVETGFGVLPASSKRATKATRCPRVSEKPAAKCARFGAPVPSTHVLRTFIPRRASLQRHEERIQRRNALRRGRLAAGQPFEVQRRGVPGRVGDAGSFGDLDAAFGLGRGARQFDFHLFAALPRGHVHERVEVASRARGGQAVQLGGDHFGVRGGHVQYELARRFGRVEQRNVECVRVEVGVAEVDAEEARGPLAPPHGCHERLPAPLPDGVAGEAERVQRRVALQRVAHDHGRFRRHAVVAQVDEGERGVVDQSGAEFLRRFVAEAVVRQREPGDGGVVGERSGERSGRRPPDLVPAQIELGQPAVAAEHGGDGLAAGDDVGHDGVEQLALADHVIRQRQFHERVVVAQRRAELAALGVVDVGAVEPEPLQRASLGGEGVAQLGRARVHLVAG
mmetsp:Transcript_8289/g.29341  ORF Transcript_8289/g.29341 Transcript_8289/m.29341 type:complete len:447 (-) Transcript_8289:922-2262(-)